MKSIVNFALAASLAAGATAQPHAHQHRHVRKHESPVLNLERASPVLKERDVSVVWETPTVTDYVLGGETITKEEADQCLNEGSCEVVGESTPTFVAPTPSTTPTSTKATPTSTKVTSTSTKVSSTSSAATSTSSAATTSSKVNAAEFFEFDLSIGATFSSSSVVVSTSATTSAATTTATSSSSSSGATGVDADFPDGTLDCDAGVPSAYGAVAIDHLDTDGWAGILNVGLAAFEIGSTSSIASFSVATSGGVSEGMFGLYACPEGYDAAQWPEDAQGATGQSIGGIWCGSDNKLYLTRPHSTKKLCQAGAGGVKIINKLSDKVSFCKTLYPGTESMVLPTVVEGGATAELYNPYQNLSYTWEGSTTSAQYYVNLKGLGADVACVWDSPDPYSENAGNWAGINVGTSVDDDGVTFLSVFHNTPTSDAPLDFNIKLSGDISSECTYSYSDNSFSPDNGNGCTVSKESGGTIYITLSD